MSVSFGTIGATAAGSASIDVPYPASISAGDLLLLAVVNKYPTDSPSTPSGWTLVNQATGGAGSVGVGSGNVYTTVFSKIAVGDEAGNLTVNIPDGNCSGGAIARYTRSGGIGFSIASAIGADNSPGTDFSAACASDPGIAAGDIVVAVVGVNDDNGFFSSQAIAASGVTFGTINARLADNVAPGDDAELNILDAAASSGASAGNPSFSATRNSSTAETICGGVVIVRIRESVAASGVPQTIIIM